MDKKLVLAVAGSGKTTEIVNRVHNNDRTIIITYTDSNYENIKFKLIKKFGEIPSSIRIYTYFNFLYHFCFLPFKQNLYVKGIDYTPINNRYLSSDNLNYYMNMKSRKMYHSRLAKFCGEKLIAEVNNRLEKYFDNIYIDEVQDFSGHDFNFLLNIINNGCSCLIVGDFYQHTYDTSRDGSVNKNLYNDFDTYVNKFKNKVPNLIIDQTNFIKSKRCSREVCEFITNKLGIKIESYDNHFSVVQEINEKNQIDDIIKNDKVAKLFYQNSKKYNIKNVDNWGNSKGITYENVCVVLNPNSFELYRKDSLENLSPTTRNKLYVACSRPVGDLYIINEQRLANYLNK